MVVTSREIVGVQDVWMAQSVALDGGASGKRDADVRRWGPNEARQGTKEECRRALRLHARGKAVSVLYTHPCAESRIADDASSTSECCGCRLITSCPLHPIEIRDLVPL